MLVILLMWPASAPGAEYYVGPNGADSNPGTKQQPWASIDRGVDQLTPGDTLYLKDGTYHESVTFKSGDSGTADNPVTLKALHDGRATVSGKGFRSALALHADHVVVEGMVFKWANRHVVTVGGDHNVLRRISAYYGDFDDGDDYDTALIVTGKHNLVVDAIGAGSSSHVFESWAQNETDMHNTFRRVFAYGGAPDGYPHGPSRSEFNMYGVSNVIVENCIGWGGSKTKSISVHSNNWDDPSVGIDDNGVYGSIFMNSRKNGMTIGYAYNSSGTHVQDVVVANNAASGIAVWGGLEGSGETIRDVTAIGNGDAGIDMVHRYPNREVDHQVDITNALVVDNGEGFGGDDPTSVTYTNSWGNDRRNFSPVKGEGCFSKDPKLPDDEIPVTIPSKSPCVGAGKDGTTIGAEIRYRYVGGEKTDEPLWPWPMQDRIAKELGFDVNAKLAPDTAGSTVRASADPTSGAAPLEVQFEAAVSGTDSTSSVTWSFGDGSASATGTSVTHTYDEPGSYTASVEVQTGAGEPLTDDVEISVRDVSTLRAASTDRVLTIDGKLDESAWTRASTATVEGASSDNRTDVRGVWTDRHLVLGFRVVDDRLERSADADPWKNDGVEFAVDPARDRGDRLEADDRKWIVGLDGTVTTSTGRENTYWKNAETPAGVEAAAERTPAAQSATDYRVEVKIPWKVLGQMVTAGDRLGLLLANIDRDDGSAAQVTWNSEIRHDTPATWGTLRLVEADPSSEPSPDIGGSEDATDADGATPRRRRACSNAPGRPVPLLPVLGIVVGGWVLRRRRA